MLCINVDISAYTQISELALKLGGIVPNHAEQASEIFVDGVSNSVNQVLTELYGENIPQHFSMDERTNILRILSDRKIFLIKGAVPRVARMLGCSEPTVYRGIKSCEAMTCPTAAAGLKLEQHIKTAASVISLAAVLTGSVDFEDK